MTTTAPPKAARAKRTPVPAPASPSSTSPALDALTSSPHPAGAVLVDVDLLRPHPGNPRRDLGDLVELTDSIRAHGVRQNLLVVPNPDEPGAYRLVIGHRRTAAARLADVTALPAVIDPSLTDAEQLELMLLENLQRTDLTAIEEADAYQGLLDLGLDTAAIAKTTGRSRATVAARLRLRGLPAAAQEKVHTHQATLDDAARLLDFTDHPDVLATLTEQLGERDFIHQVQRSANEIAAAAARAAATAALVADGVTVVEDPAYDDKVTCALYYLTNNPKGGFGSKVLDGTKHGACPGHVAWVTGGYHQPPTVTLGCTGWKANGHVDRRSGNGTGSSAGPKSDDEKAQRRELIANNKASVAAEVVRRAWLTEFLTRTKLPADAAVYVARVFNLKLDSYYNDQGLAFEFFGAGARGAVDAQVAASPARAMTYLVALAAARVEKSMPKDYWRVDSQAIAIHLQTLGAWGYPLADVERAYVTKHGPKATAR